MNIEEAARDGRIADSFLAAEVKLFSNEKLLTWADYYCSKRFPSSGTLFLTSMRLVWIKWNRAWTLLGGDRPPVIEIALADIEGCRTGWSIWRIWGSAVVIRVRAESDEIRLLPLRGSTDVRAWAKAINDLRAKSASQ